MFLPLIFFHISFLKSSATFFIHNTRTAPQMTIKKIVIVCGLYRNMLFIVDYCNPVSNIIECLVLEAGSYNDAQEEAIKELKLLEIPKRYIIKIEEF